jgi:hypothetical protein
MASNGSGKRSLNAANALSYYPILLPHIGGRSASYQRNNGQFVVIGALTVPMQGPRYNFNLSETGYVSTYVP